MARNVINPATLLTAGVHFQPLFADFDNNPGTGIKPVISPEVRAVDTSYAYGGTPTPTTPPPTQQATGSFNGFHTQGFTSALLVFTASMTAGASANDKDVNVRVTRWYPVKVPSLDLLAKEITYFWFPVKQTYDVTFGSYTNADSDNSALTAASYFADTIVAAISSGTPDNNVYSPANNLIGTIALDVHGAPIVTVEVEDGSATPDFVQVFYGLE